MGLGSTAKKVQQMVDIAEKLHARVMDIKDRVEGTQETVDETAERVTAIESELAEQRKIIDAIASEHDIDVDPEGTPATDSGLSDSDTAGGDDNA